MAKSGNDATIVALAIVAVVAYYVYRRWRESQQAAGSDTGVAMDARAAPTLTQHHVTADRMPHLPALHTGDGTVIELMPLLVRMDDDREATVYVVKDCRALTLVAGETEAQQRTEETGARSRRAAASTASAQRPTTASTARARTGRRRSSRSRSGKQSTGCCGPSKPKEAKSATASRRHRSRSTGAKRSQSRSKKAAKPAAAGRKSRSRSRHAGTGQSRTAGRRQSVRSGSEPSLAPAVAAEPVNVG